MNPSSVFPPDFAETLAGLRISARRVAKGGPLGEHHAREAGSGLEFRDYRAYVPGDDFRRVDWKLWARFERLYLKLQDELRELPVHLLVDLSDSAFAEEPPRALAALRVAGVFAAIALNELDPVSVFAAGATIGASIPPVSGKRSLPQLLERIAALGPEGRTDLLASAEALAKKPLRKGLAVLISDFYDPKGLPAIEAAVLALPHRVVLVRLMDPSGPVLDGELLLQDAETGEELVVTVDAELLSAHRAAEEAFAQGLRDLAAAREVPLLEIDIKAPLLPQFAALFPDGVFVP